MMNPLQNYSKVSVTGRSVFQYYIKVIPTNYTFLNGVSFVTNQYSVTEHSRPIDENGIGLPGLFINYDFSPIMVNIVESRKPFGHFLTAVCAIIGGVFTVMGVLDSFTYQLLGPAAPTRTPKGLLD